MKHSSVPRMVRILDVCLNDVNELFQRKDWVKQPLIGEYHSVPISHVD